MKFLLKPALGGRKLPKSGLKSQTLILPCFAYCYILARLQWISSASVSHTLTSMLGSNGKGGFVHDIHSHDLKVEARHQTGPRVASCQTDNIRGGKDCVMIALLV